MELSGNSFYNQVYIIKLVIIQLKINTNRYIKQVQLLYGLHIAGQDLLMSSLSHAGPYYHGLLGCLLRDDDGKTYADWVGPAHKLMGNSPYRGYLRETCACFSCVLYFLWVLETVLLVICGKCSPTPFRVTSQAFHKAEGYGLN